MNKAELTKKIGDQCNALYKAYAEFRRTYPDDPLDQPELIRAYETVGMVATELLQISNELFRDAVRGDSHEQD